MRSDSFGAVVLFFAATAVAAIADAITPSSIVADPSSFEGKQVTVTGKVALYQTSKTMMRTVAAFQLCDSKCIVVIDQKNTKHANGDEVTVTGAFQTKFKGPKRSFDNVVMIK